MVVCHKEITVGLLLKPHKIFQSSEIASQVQVACRTHSADYGFHVAKLVNLPEVTELEGKKTKRPLAFAKGKCCHSFTSNISTGRKLAMRLSALLIAFEVNESVGISLFFIIFCATAPM